MPEAAVAHVETPNPEAGASVGLIGCGDWGRHILRDLRDLGCAVHVVARSSESIERATAGGAASIVSAIELLPKLDGVVIASITSKHAECIGEVAASQVCPIFCEKPLCDDAATAERLAASCGDRLFVMDKWRYHPGVLEIARIARGGELGRLRSVHTRRVTNRSKHPDVSTVWTHAPHDLAIGLEILGELPDARFAVGEFSGERLVGLTGTLGLRGAPPWLNLEISDAAPAHRRELRIVCDGGSAQLDGGWAESVTVRADGAVEDEQRPTPGELPLRAELRAFVEHLGGGPPPKSSAAEGAAQVRLIEQLIAIATANEAVGA